MSSDDLNDIEAGDEQETRAETPALRLGRGVHEITLAQYLMDPCESPSLRSSDVNTILRMRPAHVKAWHPRLTDYPKHVHSKLWRETRQGLASQKRLDLGSVVHGLALGKGGEFTVINKGEFETKSGKPAKGSTDAYKAACADARARGLIVLDDRFSDIAQRMTERITSRLAAMFGEWPIGETECTLIWSERVVTQSGQEVDVWCRSRPDIYAPALRLVPDLKTTGNGLSDDDVQRTLSADDGRLLIQAAWQRRGTIALNPTLAGRLDPMTHIFAETSPPYEVSDVDASVISLQQAHNRCSLAIELFAEMIAADTWDAWPRRRIVSAAPWLEARWLDDEGDIET